MASDEQGIAMPPTPGEAQTATDQEPLHDEETAADPTSHDDLWQVVNDPEGAREVSANHIGRLMYSSRESWSRYVFHENKPYPLNRVRR